MTVVVLKVCMKVIVKIEDEQGMEHYERFLRAVNPALVSVRKKRKIIKSSEFLISIDKIAVSFVAVHIPNREFRSTR
jgi:hypothetical protein